MLVFLFQLVFSLLVLSFVFFVALEIRSLAKARQAKLKTPRFTAKVDESSALPMVSVLLPIYNEKRVVAKIIHAACQLKYPREQLEILILDDSTDATKDIIAQNVAVYQEQGLPIRHLRREKRIGYKAGNLNFGLSHARGEFLAIFDADFLPDPHFLLQVMPSFEDSQVGFLQTGIDYANKHVSFLTLFQAVEAGHKEGVTQGLAQDGFMASLTGSSCVWRRSCIDDIGGISAETITEDVDMGYKAQLQDWKYVFLPEVVSWAELPESMASFRVQRQRWARGLVQNTLRHIYKALTMPMPLFSRLHALALMGSTFLLASFYLLVLLALPATFIFSDLGMFFNSMSTIFLLTAMSWAWSNMMVKGGGLDAPVMSLGKKIMVTYGYVVMFFPLSLYYFSAVVQTLAGSNGRFYRTPKGKGRNAAMHPPINTWLIGLELFSFCYAVMTMGFCLAEKNYWVLLFSTLAASGFALTLFFSFCDYRYNRKTVAQHVLITGATGALGSALALCYAGPGRQLTLQGRNSEALDALAKECRTLGAQVCTKVLDLRQIQDLRQWVGDWSAENLPDLIICNAGQNTNIGPQGQGEDFRAMTALVEVNVLATMALIDGFVPALRARGHGQIAIVSSLAGYFGLPMTPTYSATKAALRIYGDALRTWLGQENIKVNVILPGYIASPMCHAMPGPKPFLWQPQRAAQVIQQGLQKNKAHISFPFPLNLGVWALSVLPVSLARPIARLFGYGS